MLQIGSIIIPILLIMFLINVLAKFVLKTSLYCYKARPCRRVGMFVENHQGNFGSDVGILFKEGYYELSIGTWLHTIMFMKYTSSWGERYFGTACDATSSGLAILTLIFLITLPMHAVTLRL